MELPAGDGAPLLETDHSEPNKGSRLTPVGTLEHHRDLQSKTHLIRDPSKSVSSKQLQLVHYLFLECGKYPRSVVESRIRLHEAVLQSGLAPGRVRLTLVELHDAGARPVSAEHWVEAAVELLTPIVVEHLTILPKNFKLRRGVDPRDFCEVNVHVA